MNIGCSVTFVHSWYLQTNLAQAIFQETIAMMSCREENAEVRDLGGRQQNVRQIVFRLVGTAHIVSSPYNLSPTGAAWPSGRANKTLRTEQIKAPRINCSHTPR